MGGLFSPFFASFVDGIEAEFPSFPVCKNLLVAALRLGGVALNSLPLSFFNAGLSVLTFFASFGVFRGHKFRPPSIGEIREIRGQKLSCSFAPLLWQNSVLLGRLFKS